MRDVSLRDQSQWRRLATAMLRFDHNLCIILDQGCDGLSDRYPSHEYSLGELQVTGGAAD